MPGTWNQVPATGYRLPSAKVSVLKIVSLGRPENQIFTEYGNYMKQIQPRILKTYDFWSPGLGTRTRTGNKLTRRACQAVDSEARGRLIGGVWGAETPQRKIQF